MNAVSGPAVRRFSQLGAGEIVARLASISSIILLGHLYGAIALAAFALGQALTLYLQPAIDFGLRHIGARLVAVYPDALAAIIQRIQRRRIGMAAAALPILLIYAFSTDLSHSMRIFVFLFSAMGGFYALSLDWAAWGLGDLQVVGFARAIVPVSILACLLAGIASSYISSMVAGCRQRRGWLNSSWVHRQVVEAASRIFNLFAGSRARNRCVHKVDPYQHSWDGVAVYHRLQYH